MDKLDLGSKIVAMKHNWKTILFIVLPLILSALISLWNAAGFPDQAPDDGTYIRRALTVLGGSGPQEGTFYDHPYFGQIFLGAVFAMIGYPDIAVHQSSASLQDFEISVEMLYTIPRVLMGVLGIVDTFLVYKIAEVRYSRKVGFIAAILFAVTPLSWLFRRMYLDPILLPFLLISILFALYSGAKLKTKEEGVRREEAHSRLSLSLLSLLFKKDKDNDSKPHSNAGSYRLYANNGYYYRNKNTILILISGIFLGLAIFTKVPAVTLIPLVGWIIFTNNNRSFRALGVWFIPVVLIPLIWPVYAISEGQLENWLDGIRRERPESFVWNSIRDLLKIDPVLVMIGLASLVYAGIRRDWFLLLWIIPFLLFFYFVGRITYNFWVPMVPLFCIGGSKLIVDLSSTFGRGSQRVKNALPFAVISVIALFGLIVSAMLLNTNLTSSQIEAAAFVLHEVVQQKESNTENSNESNVTIISAPSYSWIFKYVYDEENVFDNFRDRRPIETEKIILMADSVYEKFLKRDKSDKADRIELVHDNTATIAKFEGAVDKYDYDKYPYFSMGQARSGSEIDIRANH